MNIHQLALATLDLPDWHPASPGKDTIHGFLIEAPNDLVLVDTGVGADSDFINQQYAPRCPDLTNMLASLGFALTDVSKVINSHLHFDHCGNNRLFPDATIYVNSAEYEDAKADSYTVREWYDFPDAKYEFVNARREISPGVEIIPTPGHTRGHLSVGVQEDKGLDVVAAQAIYTLDECEAALAGSKDVAEGNWDDDVYRRSRKLIFDLNPLRIYFSHDGQVWER